MAKRIPRLEEQHGVLVSAGDETRSVQLPLGSGRGVLSIRVTPEGKRHNAVQLYIRWTDRPGDPISVQDDGILGFDKDYLTHVLLDLETGEVYPGYQAGDPQIESILG